MHFDNYNILGGLAVLATMLLVICTASTTSSQLTPITSIPTDENLTSGPTVIPSVILSSPTHVPSEPSTPQNASSSGEPVSVIVSGDELIITNNTTSAIYYVVFPQEILPLIEWAPCQHPADCAEIKIEAGQSVQLSLHIIADANTTIITVFWWHLIEKTDGSGYYNPDLTSLDIEIR